MDISKKMLSFQRKVCNLFDGYTMFTSLVIFYVEFNTILRSPSKQFGSSSSVSLHLFHRFLLPLHALISFLYFAETSSQQHEKGEKEQGKICHIHCSCWNRGSIASYNIAERQGVLRNYEVIKYRKTRTF